LEVWSLIGGQMHIAIVGNGIAGISTARHVRKRSPTARITIISGESDYHWSRPALMYVFMGHMRFKDTQPYPPEFFRKNRIHLLKGWVTDVALQEKTLVIDGARTLAYDKLVFALGSKPNRFGWPGQDLARVHGMYSVQDLASLHQLSPSIHRGAIVGGGLIGVELAEMLHTRGKHVTMLVRESRYWDNVLPAEEADMVTRVIRREGIDLRLETELTEIEGNEHGEACAVVDSAGDRVPVEFVGLTAGVRPNIDWVKNLDLETGRGILVDQTLATSVPDVYACGDCAEIQTPEGERNLIQAVWYTGRMQGETVARNLCGEQVDYEPGIWFNSAKFFDLEYQVYGTVPSARGFRESGAPETSMWLHPDKLRSVRLVHRNGKVIGFNLMGIRFRHEVCEKWIAEERSVDWVLKRLKKAHFDPELYRTFYREIRQSLGGAS